MRILSLSILVMAVCGCTTATYNVYNELQYERGDLALLQTKYPHSFMQVYYLSGEGGSASRATGSATSASILDGYTSTLWLQPGRYSIKMYCQWGYQNASTATPRIIYTVESGKSYRATCKTELRDTDDTLLGKSLKRRVAKVVIGEDPSLERTGYYKAPESS